MSQRLSPCPPRVRQRRGDTPDRRLPPTVPPLGPARMCHGPVPTPPRHPVRISAALRTNVRESDAAGGGLLIHIHALSPAKATARICSIMGLPLSRRRNAARQVLSAFTPPWFPKAEPVSWGSCITADTAAKISPTCSCGPAARAACAKPMPRRTRAAMIETSGGVHRAHGFHPCDMVFPCLSLRRYPSPIVRQHQQAHETWASRPADHDPPEPAMPGGGGHR